MKEIHLLILKQWSEGQGSAGILLRTEAGGHYLLTLLCAAKACRHHLFPTPFLVGVIFFFFFFLSFSSHPLFLFSLFLSLLFLFSVDAIFVLPLCPASASGHQFCALPLLCSRVPLSPGGEALHTSGELVFTSADTVFAAVTQGMPLDHLARGACIPGSHRTVTIIEIVLRRLPSLGYCIDSTLKHTPILFVKVAYLLIQELQPWGQASGLAHT